LTLESVANQTVLPNETLVVFSIRDSANIKWEWDYLERLQIPNLNFFVRGGDHSAGNNRRFLIEKSSSPILSFFDCDDFSLPQRTEVIHTIFSKFPDVEAVLHTYRMLRMDSDAKVAFPELPDIPNNIIQSWTPPIRYEELWEHSSVMNYTRKKWVIDDPATEPNHPPKSASWWMPRCFKGKYKFNTGALHNGWLSIRASTAREVPYPDLFRGQDSLYNWRLLKSKRNVTWVDMTLGLYIRPYLFSSPKLKKQGKTHIK